MPPEVRLLRALDEFRDALAAVLADRRPPVEPAALLTLSAAADLIGVSRSTVTRWADSGRLVTVGPPNARRVPRSEVDALASGRQ
jgi:excisionase family DNA binding protein